MHKSLQPHIYVGLVLLQHPLLPCFSGNAFGKAFSGFLCGASIEVCFIPLLWTTRLIEQTFLSERREDKIHSFYKNNLPDRESNPGLPRDRRGYSPLYYRGLSCLCKSSFFKSYFYKTKCRDKFFTFEDCKVFRNSLFRHSSSSQLNSYISVNFYATK